MSPTSSTLTISCEDCTMRHSSACEDCVVTFICDREPGDAVIIDVEEARALRLLGRSGLVPPLQHRTRRGSGAGVPVTRSP
ncbi:MAG: hypothetical protein ACRDWW_02035 [Acidimicrobiales bacterium]